MGLEILRLALRTFSVAALICPLASFSATTGAPNKKMGIIIERHLGREGDLGEETLLLECGVQTRESCDLKKTTNGVSLSGKIARVDASQIVKKLFQAEEKRSSKSEAQTKPAAQPTLFWGAELQGKTLHGSFKTARDRFDFAVLVAEQDILRKFKP